MKTYGKHIRITGQRWTTNSGQKVQEVHYRYEEKIVTLLDTVRATDSGRALLADIESSPGTITIMPPLQKKVQACYAQVQPYLKGSKVASEVELEYLPSSYGDACSGVGTSPEEVLFHELVHLSQIVRGYLLETPIPKAPHMTNFTEFCAVTASNILRSELGRPGLRAGHEGRKEATTLTDPKDYYAFYKDEINQWFRIQAVLCGALSRVNAPFNPLRAKKAAEPAIQAVFR